MYEYVDKGGNFCVTPDHDISWHGRSHNRDIHWRKARADKSTTGIDRHMMKTVQWECDTWNGKEKSHPSESRIR
jgi:hypothetical protein